MLECCHKIKHSKQSGVRCLATGYLSSAQVVNCSSPCWTWTGHPPRLCILILSVSWQCPSCLLKTYVCQRSGTTASGSSGIHLSLLQWVTGSSTSPSMVHTHTHTSIKFCVSISLHKYTFMYAIVETNTVKQLLIVKHKSIFLACALPWDTGLSKLFACYGRTHQRHTRWKTNCSQAVFGFPDSNLLLFLAWGF